MSGRSLRKRQRVEYSEPPVDTQHPPAKKGRGRGRPKKREAAEKALPLGAEFQRLHDISPWRRWGPYLSERQWGTVREDYSNDGNCWEYFPHDMAPYRAYQWGEDGLFGLCDEGVNVCLSLALWNGKDPMLKERLFGLTGPQGNHGEDVKEVYYYLDSTPSHSYMRSLYKYPQVEFPYQDLVDVNASRSNTQPEYEITDTGVFAENKYWDVEIEVGKDSPTTFVCQYTLHNRREKPETISVLPQACFRNTWSWDGDTLAAKPAFKKMDSQTVAGHHSDMGNFQIHYLVDSDGNSPQLLFTNNDTNLARMKDVRKSTAGTKDAFHEYVVKGKKGTVTTATTGTKIGALYNLTVGGGQSCTVKFILTETPKIPRKLIKHFEGFLAEKRDEANQYYSQVIPEGLSSDEEKVARQAYAGLLWTKQFFFYDVAKWLEGGGDIKTRINKSWQHMLNKDIISMPDKWEFPWYATWDLAFHMVPFAHVDVEFAKHQLLLFLSDRYMHPNGQLPAYEFNFSDVNPPVHAWACLHIFNQTVKQGTPDLRFLKKCFQRLLLNFNWWVNQKSVGDSHIFAGGFLGMDNISVVERSHPPEGATMKQADGTGWMAFYSSCMLQMALELAQHDDTYTDMASRFLDHYVSIVKDINAPNGGLWDEEDQFYYDQMEFEEESHVLRVRSLVGLLPMVATTILDASKVAKVPEVQKKLQSLMGKQEIKRLQQCPRTGSYLLSIPSEDQLRAMLKYMLAETEFLSKHGIRAMSMVHDEPFTVTVGEEDYSVHYCPGESDSDMFGGNSNWRGPIWICMNSLLIEGLQKYSQFYGTGLTVEYPTSSGRKVALGDIADDIAQRLVNIFLPDAQGRRPCHGDDLKYANDPHWKDLVLFNEYFHADTGRGCGASHQTGWTGLVVCFLQQLAKMRNSSK